MTTIPSRRLTSGAGPAEGQRDELDDPEAEGQQRDDEQQDDHEAARLEVPGRVGRRREEAHEPQQQELAVGRRRLAEALDGLLEVVGTALGERQRRVGHAPQLHALLRARGRDGAAEVVARGVGVVALGRPGAEDRERGGLELLLALELLVGAVLERLHGGEGALLLDADLTGLGRHGEGRI